MANRSKTSNQKFLKVVCPRCSREKMIYGKSTSKIKCDNCNLLLTKSTGGKTRIKAFVRGIFGRWR